MLTNLKIRTRLFGLLGFLLLITIAVGALGLDGTRRSNAALESVYSDRLLPLLPLKTISDAYAKVIETAHKVELSDVTPDHALVSVDSLLGVIEHAWAVELGSKQSDEEQALVTKAEQQMADARASIDRLRGNLRSRDVQGVSRWLVEDSYRALNPVTESIDLIRATQVEETRQEHERSVARYRTTRNLILGATLLGALAALGSGTLIIRDIVSALKQVERTAERIAAGDLVNLDTVNGRHDELGNVQRAMHRMVGNLSGLIGEVRRSGIQVNTSTTEISATSRQQQTTASEVASTTLEIGATAREISATSKELVRTMDDLMASAEAMTALAGNGRQGLARMETTMQQITEATSGINARFAVLNDRAANINTVVTTIAKVADRTNLLSLNAAIEAEKAGEYGRGFAVVATEIRRLADQTADATTDIEQMVREIQGAISAGVMGTDKFSEEVRRAVQSVGEVSTQLAEIIQQVQLVTPRFEAIVEGMQSQSDGAQQISEALEQLGEASQQTVESLVQSTQALEQLNDAARGLQSGVSRFKLAN